MEIPQFAARFARVATIGATLAIAGIPGTGSVSAADLIVNIDEASVHRLMREAATIVVGNPSIADVNIQGDTMLLVMGKTPGHTNIIALDRKGTEIENLTVHVRNAGSRRLTLHLGAERESYNCAPVCDRALAVSDSEKPFDVQLKQIQGKTAVSQGNAAQQAGVGQ